MNTLSNFTIKVLSVLPLLAAFPKATGEPYEWSGALMEAWPTRSRLYVAVHLNNDLYCEFAFILVSFEPLMAHNLVWFLP